MQNSKSLRKWIKSWFQNNTYNTFFYILVLSCAQTIWTKPRVFTFKHNTLLSLRIIHKLIFLHNFAYFSVFLFTLFVNEIRKKSPTTYQTLIYSHSSNLNSSFFLLLLNHSHTILINEYINNFRGIILRTTFQTCSLYKYIYNLFLKNKFNGT